MPASGGSASGSRGSSAAGQTGAEPAEPVQFRGFSAELQEETAEPVFAEEPEGFPEETEEPAPVEVPEEELPEETAEEAVVREVFEETGVKMEIDRLGFIHENFFPGDSLKKEGNIVHEISIFFYMRVPEDFEPICDSFTEDGDKERLVWIKADHPKKYYPEFFKTELSNPTKEAIKPANVGAINKDTPM